jgi:hypothetical protein
MNKNYTFKDLIFSKKSGSEGVEAFMLLPNLVPITVYGGGKEHCGDGVSTFDVISPLHKDPITNMKPEDITIEMEKIQKIKINHIK